MQKSFFIAGLLAFSLSASAETLDRVVAVVGDEAILYSDLVNLKKELTESPALANIYRINPKDIQLKELLTRMIEERVVHQAVKDLDVTVGDVEVENQIQTIAKQNNLTKKQLEDSLKHEGINYDSYKKNIQAQLERRNIFDRELRKGGGGVADSEIRALYDQKAETEYKLSVIALKKNAFNKKKLQQLAKDIANHKISLKEADKQNDGEELGWVTADTLNPKLANLVKKSNPGEALGPVEIEKTLQLLLYDANRHGSEEGFQKAKPELSQMVQGQDFDKRFSFWLERKKQELHIVVNDL